MTCPSCAQLEAKYPGARVRPCPHEDPEWKINLDLFTPLHQPKGEATGGAQIFCHPHALHPLKIGVLQSCLEEHGYDMNEVRIGPPSKRGFCELTRLRRTGGRGEMLLERFDGSQFTYWPEGTKPAPEAA